ncbi:hypothetical protein CBL_21261, partial [Carabus blaptoides fortunei]
QPVRDNTKDSVKDLADKPSADVSMNSVRTKGDLIISPRSEIICTGTRENPQSNTGYEEAVSVANRKSDCTGNHRVMNVNELDIATQFQAKHLKPTDELRLHDLIKEYRDLFMTEGKLEPIWDCQYIRREQQFDLDIRKIVENVMSENPTEFYLDDEGLLYKMRTQGEHEDRLVAPATMVDKILKTYHDLPQAAHQGYDQNVGYNKTSILLESQRKTSPHLKPAPLQRFAETLMPFDRVSMDIVGP